MPTPLPPGLLLLAAAAGVALVVILVTWVRLPAFLALALASVFVGVAARMPLSEIPRAFQQGVGDTLGFIAMVIALGTVIGKLLAESGGALVVSGTLVRILGERRLDWAMMLSGFIIGLPVFFQVGLVLLAPVLFTLTRQTGTSLVRLGVPLVAGLSAAHGLVPPHPGPLAAIERLGADTGRTLLYSIIVALPLAIAAGPVFGRMISRRVHAEPGAMADQLSGTTTAARSPSLGVALATILLPVLVMMLAALAQTVLADGTARRVLVLAGSPLVAMLLATLLALYTFGVACGFDRARLLRFAEDALPPVASVLLVVGAGGGFGRILDAAGVDSAIAEAMSGMALSPLALGWLMAALLRLSVGSATVACVTAASIMAPLGASMPQVSRELMVLAIGAGSLIASHVNDGGFWLVKEYLNLGVGQTVATWTVLETIISVLGLILVLLLGLVVS
ncbi:MAG TPA: gluconate:H+ symporter [Vicinamibacterales bacterium]|nr:gluconate:H+ symporter [Vicinamibacterales bacterium]